MTATAQPDSVQHAEHFQLHHAADGSRWGAVMRLTTGEPGTAPQHHIELPHLPLSQAELFHLGESLIAISAAPSSIPGTTS